MFLTEKLLQLVMPKVCLVCQELSTNTLCNDCQRLLPWSEDNCWRCAACVQNELLCLECQNSVPAFDYTRVLFANKAPVSQLLCGLRHGKLAVSTCFANFLAEELAHQPSADIIVPLPLNPYALSSRGYNPNWEIVKNLPTHYNFAPNLLTRIGNDFRANTNLEDLHLVIISDELPTINLRRRLSVSLKEQGAARLDYWAMVRRAKL